MIVATHSPASQADNAPADDAQAGPVQADQVAPRASVIIPAYNEGKVIDRCLASLIASPVPLEVVVSANGCTDDTVARAQAHEGVIVLDSPVGSKVAALNDGDAAASAFPRIYLDADIVLDSRAIEALVDALDVPQARVASPRIQFHTADSDIAVRSFYSVFTELPYVKAGLVGLGVYGLSRAGRERFTDFPQLQADDLFVQRLFAPEERLITDGTFTVQAPRDLANLIKVRTRVASGNAELAEADDHTVTAQQGHGDFATSTGGTMRALLDLATSNPRHIPGAFTYTAVTLAARLRARRPASATWQRDTSTR